MNGFPSRLRQQWRRLQSVLLTHRLRHQGVACGELGEVVGRLPLVHNAGTISLGDGITFRGIAAAPELYAAAGAHLEIGDHSHLNSGVCLHASQRIVLGPRCLLAEWVMISDFAFHEIAPDEAPALAPVVIGANVWLGVRTIVLPGVTIGDHTVVGAGSIVSRSLPARCVAAGAPARVLRTFDCPDHWRRR